MFGSPRGGNSFTESLNDSEDTAEVVAKVMIWL